MMRRRKQIRAIDLFCGAGGLSLGLKRAGVSVVAGVDTDRACQYPYEQNVESPFLERDVRTLTGELLNGLWPAGDVRLLAGCAPCQPFSAYRRGADTRGDEKWPLLDEFGRLIRETGCELVTMENVTRVQRSEVFGRFVETLRSLDYYVSFRSCYGPDYGLPQERRRMVLLASRLGPVDVPRGSLEARTNATVEAAIGDLPSIEAGAKNPEDKLHQSRSLSDLNLQRMRASVPGGTWRDWPDELRSPCHVRATGNSFQSVYARMEWDRPSPTITTMAHNFGTGRFGHPEQDRAISLREAAVLQGFPLTYRFTAPNKEPQFQTVGRMIGNAVPPPLGQAIGAALRDHVTAFADGDRLK